MSRAADILRRRRGDPVMGGYGRPQVTEDEINGVMSAEERAAETERFANAPISAKFPERLASPTPGGEMLHDPELEEAASALQSRPGSIPAQVGQAVTQAAPQPPVDNRDAEELAAQEADRQSRNNQRIEHAGRQFVAGVTQTPLSPGIGAAPSQVPQAQAAAKSRAERAADLVRQKRQGVMDESALKLQASQTEKNLRDPAPKGGIDYTPIKEGELDLKNRTLAEKIRATKERERRASQPKTAKPMEDIPPGFEVSSGSVPGKETRRDFSKLVTTAERMKGLTSQMREALKGTSGAGRVLDPAIRTRLKQLSTQIQIEAKDVAGLGALSGPDMALMEAMASDPTSISSNLAVDMPTMLGQLDKWADNSVEAKSKGTGIIRIGAKTEPRAPGTKTVGGVTYEKRSDGKWYPAGGK